MSAIEFSPGATASARATATVIGGGPGGLMAAEVLAGAGLAVTVYELRRSVGRKLVLAGRGGLNITHTEDTHVFLERYGPRRSQLEAALGDFGPDALRDWCAGLGEPTFVGSSGRVFPESFRATPLLRAWLRRLDGLGVEFRTGHRWLGWSSMTEAPASDVPASEATDGEAPDDEVPGGEVPGEVNSRHNRFCRPNGSIVEVESDVSVLALGGASWPRVGSDGSWVTPLGDAGVGVVPLSAANCGVRVDWTEHLVDRFAGLPLKNISVSVSGSGSGSLSGTASRRTVRGDAMITRTGLEGGPIYAHSAAIRDRLDRAGRAVIEIDLQPDLTSERLTARFDKRRPKDSMSTRLRKSGLRPESIAVLRDALRNELPADLSELARVAKAVPVEVTALMPIDRAISSAGGVMFHEVDSSFMLRRLPGTFLAGEMLDWEAPTGGYLLQATFSTAVAAARGAIAWLES